MNSREFKERYLFDPQRDLIAEGTYSRVFHATDALLQRDICIKLFRKELVAGSPLIREMSRAGIFFHPNVCAFYDLVEIEDINVIGEVEIQPIGIIEYMNGGTITDYIAKYSPDAPQVQKLIKDMIKGLSYLHSVGKPHLDIKPGNLLIKLSGTEPVAKITDFLNSENLHTRSVPLAIDPQQLCYRAPECFERSYGEQSFRADIWSLGIIVYEMVSGTKLFWNEGDTVEKVIRNVCYTDYWSGVHDLPGPYVDFVKKCLVRNASERSVSLEELTLILDGFMSQERKPLSPTASYTQAGPAISTTSSKTKTPEQEVAMAGPVSDEETAAPKKERSGGLSVMIIIGALLMLAGISAFIWKVIDDHDHSVPMNNTAKVITKTDTMPATNVAMNTDTSGTQATMEPKVVHDTVRIVQIRQGPEVSPFAAPPQAARIQKNIQADNPDVKVPIMPTLPHLDFLYVNKLYYFDLKTPLMSNVEYELFSENAVITTLGKNTFYIKPTQEGSIDVMVLEKGSRTKVTERLYNVKAKALPIATIGDDISGGFVSPKMLLAKLTMQARADNENYKIKSFHMTCKSGACDIQDVADNGTFNESMIKFLHNVQPGEKLYFDNIIAVDENGQPIKLDPFQLTTY